MLRTQTPASLLSQYQIEVRNITKKISDLNEKLDMSTTLSEPRENAFIRFEYKHNNATRDLQVRDDIDSWLLAISLIFDVILKNDNYSVPRCFISLELFERLRSDSHFQDFSRALHRFLLGTGRDASRLRCCSQHRRLPRKPQVGRKPSWSPSYVLYSGYSCFFQSKLDSTSCSFFFSFIPPSINSPSHIFILSYSLFFLELFCLELSIYLPFLNSSAHPLFSLSPMLCLFPPPIAMLWFFLPSILSFCLPFILPSIYSSFHPYIH